jgi:hypothetical protein
MLHIPPPKPVMATPRKLVRPGQPIARRPRRGSTPRPLTPVKPATVAEPKSEAAANPPESEKE